MIKIDKVHPMKEYLAILRDESQVYIDQARLVQAVNDCNWETENYRELAMMWIKIESDGMFRNIDKDSLVDFLSAVGVDFDKKYTNRRTGSASLDMRRTILPLIESGVQVDLLDNYRMYKTFKSYGGFMKRLYDDMPVYRNTLGRVILAYPTTVNEQDNLRAYYSDIAVVSIPKIYSTMVCGKSEEHYLAWVDYPQADWRFAYNLFIKDSRNEPVMAECEDAYEGLARLVEGDKFDGASFHERRRDYKINCLKMFYNSKDSHEIPKAMKSFYLSCPKYRRYYNALYTLQKFKLPVPCESYFGFVQMLPERNIPSEFVSKGLNTPIQTFTSEVVIETVFAVLERFWSLGYTKDDINIYYVRHDEPIFMFKKTILKDAWIFKECSSIHIDGFMPINLEFHYGSYYKQEDEELTAEINKVIEVNQGKISHYEGGVMRDYNPVPTVDSLSVRIVRDNGGCVFQFYSYNRREYKDIRINGDVFGEGRLKASLMYGIQEGLGEWLGMPKYLYVQCVGVDLMAKLWEDTLVKVVDSFDSGVFSG